MGDQVVMDRIADTTDWQRTGDIVQDQLYLYTHGYFYDCSFAVGIEKKIFKCHKVVLARASNIFAVMLTGHFNEASKNKDDTINFSDTLPETFDFAMRHIYGNVNQLEDLQLAIKVYRFAHVWQLEKLLKLAADFMAKCEPREVIPVYECFKMYRDDRLDSVLSVISKEIEVICSSPAWYSAPIETIAEILQMDHLMTTEENLFDALVLWGTTQAIEEQSVRELIDKALRFIRFRNFDFYQFSSMNLHGDLFLTDKEKVQIFMNLAMGNKCPMPFGFTDKLKFRNLHPKKFTAKFNEHGDDSVIQLEQISKTDVYFVTESEGFVLTGVRLFSMNRDNSAQELDISCQVTSSATSLKPLAFVEFKGLNESKYEDFLLFPEHVLLKENVLYTITVSYAKPCRTRKFEYGSSLKWHHGDLVWSFPYSDNNYHYDICSLSLRYLVMPEN
ncbi:BTB/POZ domain-containing protein 8-like [Neocloeon triangulifer]|uniref:BTB/POZ domain-containing protein 8-like n=1 Tax=Neocloeon triangulifer TaxID=2078957 RepID=UPI00286F1602|nr:BTB/POZ domain-containing protein 8-like [Neocloeon triangulifer]